MTDNIPKENPIWPEINRDKVVEYWKELRLHDDKWKEMLFGVWKDDDEKSEYDILAASVATYAKFSGKVVSIPDNIKTSEDFINWVRSDDDRQKDS